MEKENYKNRIHKAKRKISSTGAILEEEVLSVEGEKMKDVCKEFDKRWNK